MTSKSYGDAHSIIYVRVAPEDKKRFRDLADRDFGGSMAACFRFFLESYASGKMHFKAYASDRTKGRDIDEE